MYTHVHRERDRQKKTGKCVVRVGSREKWGGVASRGGTTLFNCIASSPKEL